MPCIAEPPGSLEQGACTALLRSSYATQKRTELKATGPPAAPHPAPVHGCAAEPSDALKLSPTLFHACVHGRGPPAAGRAVRLEAAASLCSEPEPSEQHTFYSVPADPRLPGPADRYTVKDVGNFISGSSAFSKSSLDIWKFTVHVLLKPGLEDFEHYFASM
ncbi:unnamed protein product [Rangifer tarandus platyrhynchus]|uniref:Uncharacterized protein n=1 Tax=Rangifer tarandus platyrhynchus TaxID=3082113 RepID=A0AC59Z2N2_RANTA